MTRLFGFLNLFTVGNDDVAMQAVSRFSKQELAFKGPFATYSGGFDPLHEGHLACIADAAERFGPLIIIANNDSFLKRKRQNNLALAAPLIPMRTRLAQLASLAGVALVVEGVDSDQTVVQSLEVLVADSQLSLGWFVNGGDRTPGTVPEDAVCKQHGIDMVWSVGGDIKLAESSVIITRAAAIAALRTTDVACTRWGSFCTLQEKQGEKQKILQFDSRCGVSIQTHRYREEKWRCIGGKGVLLLGKLTAQGEQLYTQNGKPVFGRRVLLSSGTNAQVALGQAHAAFNTSMTDSLLVHEIQHGDRLAEEDIVRFSDPFNNPADVAICPDWVAEDIIVHLKA